MKANDSLLDLLFEAQALDRIPLVFKAGVGYRSQAIFDELKGVIGLY